LGFYIYLKQTPVENISGSYKWFGQSKVHFMYINNNKIV